MTGNAMKLDRVKKMRVVENRPWQLIRASYLLSPQSGRLKYKAIGMA